MANVENRVVLRELNIKGHVYIDVALRIKKYKLTEIDKVIESNKVLEVRAYEKMTLGEKMN